MKKLILVVIGLILVGSVYAASTDISLEPLMNRVFNSSANTLKVTLSGGGTGDSWFDAVDSTITPDTTNAYDFGSDALRFKDAFFRGNISADTVSADGKINAAGYDIPNKTVTVTDYTDEGIQAAIDSLDTGGHVLLTSGTYTCDASIIITSSQQLNMSITGEGKETILNHTATGAADCIRLTGPSSAAASRAQGLTLSDFYIIGNTSGGDGISLINTHYALIKNIRIKQAGAYGVIANGGVGSTTYQNVIAEDCDEGGFYLTDVHQNQIINCEATLNDGPGITIKTAYETLIVGNVLEYNTIGLLIEDSTVSANPGIISGNQMSSNDADGIRIDNAHSWGIFGNLIGGNSGDGLQSTEGNKLNIVGNTMHGNADYAVNLVKSSSNQFANNYMTSNTEGNVVQQDSECFNNRISNSGIENDDIWSYGTPVTVGSCATAWVAKANVTSTLNTTVTFMMNTIYGNGSSKNIIADGFTTGLIATADLVAVDLSGATKVGFFIHPTEAVAGSVLELVLDDTAACASPLETLSIPALAADEWEYVELTLSDPSALTAVISVGLNANSDPGIVTVYIDDITTAYPTIKYDVSDNSLDLDTAALTTSGTIATTGTIESLDYDLVTSGTASGFYGIRYGVSPPVEGMIIFYIEGTAVFGINSDGTTTDLN